MPLTILKYGDCTSYNGQIRENLDYRGVGLERFQCTVGYVLHSTTVEGAHHKCLIIICTFTCSQLNSMVCSEY